MAKKPQWIIDKEKTRFENTSLWLFGIHAIRDALNNPNRRKLRLMLTENAFHKLSDDIRDIEPEIFKPHKFHPPIDKTSVHQGAAMEVEPLVWGGVDALYPESPNDIVLMLDRVSDPHNVGAILRSAEVFGARAVIAPQRHSAPETGALAKTASGALERQAYMRVSNLGNAITMLKEMGYFVIGLEGTGEEEFESVVKKSNGPIALILGSEGAGMRERTRNLCDVISRIPFETDFASLNVSNAAAISLYVARQARR